ncbi:MAG: phasin family protein [Methyloceanibacter sp.]
MTSTPRMTNGHPPSEKLPRAKPRKSGKKPPKKMTATEPIAKPMDMAKAAPAPMEVKRAPASAKPTGPAPAKPMPAPLSAKASTTLPMPPIPALDGAVESFERSFQAAGQGAMAVNAKLIDMAKANVTSGLDFMTSLATVKHPADIARLQMSFWEERMRALFSQACELRTLSSELVVKANEPIRAHIMRSFPAKAA